MDQKKIIYHEIPGDKKVFDRFYEICNPDKIRCVAIPDGMVDLQCVWSGDNLQILIAGSVKQGRTSALSDCDRCLGARFHQGYIPGLIHEASEQVMLNRIPLEQFDSSGSLYRLLDKKISLEQYVCIMFDAFHENPYEEGDLATYLVDAICTKHGCISITELIEKTGYCDRTVELTFKKRIGISMKTFARIVRLQYSLQYLLKNETDSIYSVLGYYDQAHFIHDFKSFSTLTPKTLLGKVREQSLCIV